MMNSAAKVMIRHHICSFLLHVLIALSAVAISAAQQEVDGGTCRSEISRDPNLVPLQVNLSSHEDDGDTFLAYVTPDVATFYNATPGSLKPREPSFTGLFGKFINLSKDPVRILWDSMAKGSRPSYISDVSPFAAAGTATFPSHVFRVTPTDDETTFLDTFTIQKDQSLYVYDPYGSMEQAARELSDEELQEYQLQFDNLEFARSYRNATGRDWLSLYGRQYPPRYPLWPADFLGQTHSFTTRETHFEELPPSHRLKRTTSAALWEESERRKLQTFRVPEPELNLTMTVLSCAPRVFEIRNFLSDVEVDHLLEVATGMKLSQSTTRAGTAGRAQSDAATRTSRNSWIARSRSPIVDAFYRRAADWLQIDEALLRHRKDNDAVQIAESKVSIAEHLQLVHYDPGQQYTPHHDFSVPSPAEHQPSRYATILFYLNDDMTGGETSFPRWLNARTRSQLKVTPEKGKAILFYSVLPDGNYDERSQHAALPVKSGEKWLTNLWVWDPFMRGYA